ncbi:MAG: recombinase [Parcubacteria group bacterium LiPW_15]|nr:MAG: recombinase [Parcubacteria group bacterium LiPW_15]
MKYIIYCRKSTEDEGRQILSIPAQVKELEEFAARRGLEIEKIFTESQSAKAPGRPIFGQMLDYVTKKKIRGIVCWKLDRLSRNPIDGGGLIWAIKQNDLEIITPAQSYRRDDENSILMYLEFGMAQKYIDDLSKNVKRGNKAKLEAGGWPQMAPFGYKNNKADKTIFHDPILAPYVKKMFETYATGNYSLEDITDLFYKQGLRSGRGNKVHRSRIQKILKNPFYYGMMVKDGKYYPGKHEPLISKELFDRASDVFIGRLRATRPKGLFFHLRGIFSCANCGCALTATHKKGHDYYYCTNGRGNCVEHKKYMRSETLDAFVAEALRKLQLSEDLIEVMYQAAKEKLAGQGQSMEPIQESIEKQLISLQDKQSRLVDSFIDGVTPEAVYRQKLLELGNKRVELESQLKQLGADYRQPGSTLEPTKELFLSSNKKEKQYLESSPEQRRIIAQNLLWNLSIKSQNVQEYQYKKPFSIIAKMAENPTFDNLCAGQELNLQALAGASISRMCVCQFRHPRI